MAKDEIYNVVDKQGNKIGEATWTQVHTKGLLHQCVHGLVFKDSSRKEIFFKQRTKNVPQEAGKLEIAVAGHVLAGESNDNAIAREIKEELFSNSFESKYSVKKLTSYFNNDIPNNHEIATLYEIISSGPFVIQESEAEKSFWIGLEELVKDMKNNSLKYAAYSINAVQHYISSF